MSAQRGHYWRSLRRAASRSWAARFALDVRVAFVIESLASLPSRTCTRDMRTRIRPYCSHSRRCSLMLLLHQKGRQGRGRGRVALTPHWSLGLAEYDARCRSCSRHASFGPRIRPLLRLLIDSLAPVASGLFSVLRRPNIAVSKYSTYCRSRIPAGWLRALGLVRSYRSPR